MPLHFTLGRVWETQGDHPRAFRHFLEGNRLKRAASITTSRCRRVSSRISSQGSRGWRHVRRQTVRMPARCSSWACRAPARVSWSRYSRATLRCTASGETHALRNSLREELPPDNSDYALPGRLAELDAAGFRRVAARYSRYLDEIAPGAQRVTNKLPGNMAFVGLMRLLYPQARIIHCVRDPLDTCLSCFTKLFTTGHPFSYDLRELGRFHRMYQGLMAGWDRLLPAGAVLQISYEGLVADLEGGARRLVEHCGLPWDEACLSFHTTARPVRTASLAQVRQPIY